MSTDRNRSANFSVGTNAAPTDTTQTRPGLDPDASCPYRPSTAFRRLLDRRTRPRRPEPQVLRSPGLLPLFGATLAVGVAAGFLELAVLMTQLHGLHRIGLSTLRMSRHVTW